MTSHEPEERLFSPMFLMGCRVHLVSLCPIINRKLMTREVIGVSGRVSIYSNQHLEQPETGERLRTLGRVESGGGEFGLIKALVMHY